MVKQCAWGFLDAIYNYNLVEGNFSVTGLKLGVVLLGEWLYNQML
jgi:hypothetical protein